MRRFLSLVCFILFLLASLFYVNTKIHADELDDITKQINDLTSQLNASINATKPLESQLNSMQQQIANIKIRVANIDADVALKKKQIDDGNKDLVAKEQLLNQAIRDFYIKSYYNSPLTIFLSSANAANFTRVMAYQKAAADQDKQIITNIVLSITDLEQKKKNLEDEESRLAVVKASLDDQAAKLDKVVQGAKAYQASLSGQIASLTAQQQAIISAKQSALASAAGSSIDTQTSGGACDPKSLGSYPSTIRVKFSDGHIESMPFEDQYLKGLGEMPRAWESVDKHQEAFKAQVVAARSYALYKIVRSSCRDFDVYSDTRDQAYTGNTGDSDWNNAVDSTKNQFIQSGGNVVIAYYSANSGGHTLSPQEAWNGGGSFPGGVDDTGGDGKPNGDLNARCIGTLRWEYHYNIGRDGSIQFNDTCGGDINNSNSPLSNSEVEDLVDATIWTLKNGHVPDNSMSHDQIKNDLGGDAIGPIQSISSNIVDNKYTSIVHAVGSNRTTDIDAQTFRLVFNIRSPGKYVIPSTAYGARFVKFDIMTSDQAHGTQGPGWYFYTYGYGHRIGLDQEGALGMANQGKSYTDILSHYYGGTNLTSQGYTGSVQ